MQRAKGRQGPRWLLRAGAAFAAPSFELVHHHLEGGFAAVPCPLPAVMRGKQRGRHQRHNHQHDGDDGRWRQIIRPSRAARGPTAGLEQGRPVCVHGGIDPDQPGSVHANARRALALHPELGRAHDRNQCAGVVSRCTSASTPHPLHTPTQRHTETHRDV